MKKIQEIKDEICLENGYWNYKTVVLAFKEGKIETVVFNKIIDQISIEVSRESLINASENAVTTQTYKSYDVFDFVSTVVDKKSILNESNIPKL